MPRYRFVATESPTRRQDRFSDSPKLACKNAAAQRLASGFTSFFR
jgi:hypothetical protein